MMRDLSYYKVIVLFFVIFTSSFFPVYNTIYFNSYQISTIDFNYSTMQQNYSTISKTTQLPLFLSNSSIINCLISISDEFFHLKRHLYIENSTNHKKFLLFYLFAQIIAVMSSIILIIKVMLLLAYIIYYYIQKLIYSIYQYDGKKKCLFYLVLPL